MWCAGAKGQWGDIPGSGGAYSISAAEMVAQGWAQHMATVGMKVLGACPASALCCTGEEGKHCALVISSPCASSKARGGMQSWDWVTGPKVTALKFGMLWGVWRKAGSCPHSGSRVRESLGDQLWEWWGGNCRHQLPPVRGLQPSAVAAAWCSLQEPGLH